MGTQPLPTPVGWYIALLPSWLLKILAGAIIVVEVPISFLVLSPLRGIRHVAAVSHLCVQAFIALGGGYGFFPILASALGMLNLYIRLSFFPTTGPSSPPHVSSLSPDVSPTLFPSSFPAAVPCFDDAAWAWLLGIKDAGHASERETKPLIGLPTKATGAYGTSDDSKREVYPEPRFSSRHQPLIGGGAARWLETADRNASLQAALTSVSMPVRAL